MKKFKTLAGLRLGLWLALLTFTVSLTPGCPGQAFLGASAMQYAAREAKLFQVSRIMRNLPMSFEPQIDQSGGQSEFLSLGPGYSLLLMATEAVFQLQSTKRGMGKDQAVAAAAGVDSQPTVLSMKLMGANPKSLATGVDPLPGKSNYLKGNDPRRWRTNISTYAKVQYRDVYPGVSVVYYGNGQQLEYDFVVAAGIDPRVIKLAFPGARRIRIDANGDLVLQTAGGEFRQHRPVVYQKVGGVRKEVAGHYVHIGSNLISFAIGKYDLGSQLIIDPVLSYSTFLGGNGGNAANGVAVDSTGNVYVAGGTSSTDLATAKSLQPNIGGSSDAFVMKLNSAGAVVYTTYLGGSKAETGYGITVDAAGSTYLTGITYSSNFPTTVGVFQKDLLDLNCGYPSAPDACGNAFVTKISPSGSDLVYSTYLGGKFSDQGADIAVDAEGSACITGTTNSPDFPVANAWQPQLSPGECGALLICIDAFVAKLNPMGSALVYATYLGGTDADSGIGIAVDSVGNDYVTGSTSSVDFRTTPGATQSVFGGGRCGRYVCRDGFVAKFTPAGVPLYSTFIGGGEDDFANDIAIDRAGNAYVTGYTLSSNFPTLNPLQTATGGLSTSTNGGQSWQTTNAGLIGSAIVLEIDPVNPSILYAGSLYHGIFKSTDKGQSWRGINNGVTNPGIRSLAVDPKNNSIVYACTYGGLLKSSDAGENWKPINNGLINNSCGALAVDPQNSLTVYTTGWEGRVYKSTDGGNNWMSKGQERMSLSYALTIDPHNASTIYTGSFGYIFKSTDAGETWKRIVINDAVGIRAIVIDPQNTSVVYVAAGDLFKSIDGGESWRTINTGFLDNTGLTDVDVLSLAIDPQNPTTLYAGTSSFEPATLALSLLSGSPEFRHGESVARLNVSDLAQHPPSVTDFPRPPRAANARFVTRPAQRPAVAITPDDGIVEAGIFKTTDGGENWKPINGGLSGNEVLSLAVDPTQPSRVYAGHTIKGDAFVTKLNPAGTALVYSTYLGGKSTDSGNSIAIDAAGNSYVTGYTFSINFPRVNSLQSGLKFSAQDFPTTDTFIAKLNPIGNALSWSTLLGGTGEAGDYGRGLAVDAAGNVWCVGLTYSSNFPVTPGAVRSKIAQEGFDAFVARLRADDRTATVASVSAASYSRSALAPESIVATFGSGLAPISRMAAELPLPFYLADIAIKVEDSAGVKRLAPLFYVSPTQINYQIPGGTVTGPALITVTNGDAVIGTEQLRIASVAPGLFAANANGQGVAAGLVLRIRANAEVIYETLSRFDQSRNLFIAVPIDPGMPDDQIFLVLFGTGLRNRSGLPAVSVKIGGTDTQVLYVGAQGQFSGLDQINVQLPRSLAGRGESTIELTVDGKGANPLTINVR